MVRCLPVLDATEQASVEAGFSEMTQEIIVNFRAAARQFGRGLHTARAASLTFLTADGDSQRGRFLGRAVNQYVGYKLAAPTYAEAQTVVNDTIRSSNSSR